MGVLELGGGKLVRLVLPRVEFDPPPRASAASWNLAAEVLLKLLATTHNSTIIDTRIRYSNILAPRSERATLETNDIFAVCLNITLTKSTQANLEISFIGSFWALHARH